MNSVNALTWAVCAALATLVTLSPVVHAADADGVDRATGLVGGATLFRATGVAPAGTTAESIPEVKPFSRADLQRSGAQTGQTVEADRVAAPSPAATGARQ